MSSTDDELKHLKGEAERLKAEAGQALVDFLRTDLVTCSTFASLAETEYQTGARRAGDRSLAHAEQGYSTIARFLADPKYVTHLTDDERAEFTAGMARLRATLDGLRPA